MGRAGDVDVAAERSWQRCSLDRRDRVGTGFSPGGPRLQWDLPQGP